jgi:hypothetical protein
MHLTTIGALKRLSQLMGGQSPASVAITGGTITGISALTLTGTLTLDGGTLAAAGTNQATAALIVDTVSNVTGANGTVAVRLPPATAGQVRIVYNSVATNGLPIFPATSGTINGGSGDAAITIEGKTVAILVGTDTANWAAVFTANT